MCVVEDGKVGVDRNVTVDRSGTGMLDAEYQMKKMQRLVKL